MKSQKLISLTITILFWVVSLGQENGISKADKGIKKDSVKFQNTEIRICVPSRNDLLPIYIVDGVVFENIDKINPNQIASMVVLKDTAVASIYSCKARNGVILITTKNKKKQKK